MHEQKFARVNALVDVGVHGLVEALAEFRSLETIESCQGPDGEAAWVCFRYGSAGPDAWRPVAEFVFGFLAPGLADRVGDAASLTLRARPFGVALADLAVRKEAASDVEAAIRALALEHQRLPTP